VRRLPEVLATPRGQRVHVLVLQAVGAGALALEVGGPGRREAAAQDETEGGGGAEESLTVKPRVRLNPREGVVAAILPAREPHFPGGMLLDRPGRPVHLCGYLPQVVSPPHGQEYLVLLGRPVPAEARLYQQPVAQGVALEDADRDAPLGGQVREGGAVPQAGLHGAALGSG